MKRHARPRTKPNHRQQVRIRSFFSFANLDPQPQTRRLAALIIISIGPGSLFTSLIPNLLCMAFLDAIVNSPPPRFTFAT